MLDDRRLLRLFIRAMGATSALGLLLAAGPATAATLGAEAAADFDIAEIEGDFGQPTDVAVLPDGRIVIAQRAGDVAVVTPGMADYATAHVDVNSGHGEQGLLGVVVDPDFASNGFVYFYASVGNDNSNKHKILRFKLDAAGALSARTVVLDMGLEGPANHNGGAIDIYQGNLYIGVGDTGANASPPQNHYGSCLNHANGKVLRVSLAEATLGQPPADNPLVNETMVTGCQNTGSAFAMMAPEKRIYAWGFRNPFRLWVDQTSGKLWVGDVGETTKEEISLVDVAKGRHYGYPFHEGTRAWDQAFMPAGGCMGMTPASACVEPAFDWDRGGGGASIGGRILDGCDWKPVWKSRYIFGDHEQGKVWTLDVSAARDSVTANSLKQFATTTGVAALRMGTDNALYIVEEGGGGHVSRVTAKGSTATANSCPAAGAAPTVPGGGGGGGAGGGGNGTAGNSAAGASPGGGAPGGGTGNVTPGGGTTGNAGGGSNTAGTTANGTGGSSATGTAGSATSSGGSNAAAGESDSGCGCRSAGGGARTSSSLVALGAALGVALQRRRRARRS